MNSSMNQVTGTPAVMHSQPLVSVAIPTYNRPEDLRRTLECITNQTHRNLEIIVSDNASPGEETERVARTFIENDSRVQYHRQAENRGALFNFQFVLDLARGEYFMWAADDDWRDCRFVSSLLMKLMQQPDVAIAFCDFHELDVDGDRHPGYPNHLPLLLPFTASMKWLRQWRYFMQDENLGKANLIYGLMRRSDLLDIRWCDFAKTNGPYGADMLFVFRMLGKGRLALENSALYGCKVGNVKHYGVDESVRNGWFFVLVGNIASMTRYCVRYAAIAKGASKIMFYIGIPLKVMKFFAMILVRSLLRT